MDEEKKSEASGEEELEQLGPYLLHEQVEQSHDSPVELYLATHETSGATALVRKHAAEEGAAARKDWRVRLGSWASRGYSAMEVEHSAWARAQDRQSAESLLLTLESVLEEVRRMSRVVVADTQEPRLRWSLGLGMASAAMVCALVFTLVRLSPVSHSPEDPKLVASAEPTPMSYDALTDNELPLTGNHWLMSNPDGGVPALAHPFPRKPYKGQKRPPCTPRVEVELLGACWVPHELKAPCPEELYEYQGKCYMTVMLPPPTPQSIEP
jgi:hypothetical protein